MPLVPDTPAARADARPPLKPAADAIAPSPPSTKGLKPADIDPDEMDDVIMRLFNELKRQLELIEKAEANDLRDASVREKHARILASLERTMERLAQVEAGRAAARKSTASKQDGTALDALKREISRVAVVEFARHGSRAIDERSAR